MARNQLVQLLLDHGVKAYTAHGYIIAQNTYQDAAGTIQEGWIRLRPSVKVIRHFLGY